MINPPNYARFACLLSTCIFSSAKSDNRGPGPEPIWPEHEKEVKEAKMVTSFTSVVEFPSEFKSCV